MSQYPPDTLGLPKEEMIRLGYRVVDLVVEHFCTKDKQRVIETGSPAALRAKLGGPLPLEPGDADAAINLLVAVALANQQHGDHPRYFARVPGPSSFAAVLGEWLGTGFNAIAASWTGGSGPTSIELIVIEWLRELIGLPPETEGILVSGGSIANLTAIGTARAIYGPGVAYLTDQTHSSLMRGLHHLNFPLTHIRVVKTDGGQRMKQTELRRAIAEDRAGGRRPLIVLATAGTTNTGAVDPLNAIADLCAENAMWFHVDGAYGAPSAICEQGRRYLSGIERADSIAIDPHKWLFQPYDIGCLLTTRPGSLERAYAMHPEYLRDVEGQSGEVDLRNRGLELSRRSRALKLWMTFRTYGANRIRDAIQRGIELAEHAEKILRARPQTWDVVTPAQIGVVTFRMKGASASDHERSVSILAESGYAAVSSTRVKGQSVLRLCTINPLTTETDISETLDRLAEAMRNPRYE